MFFLILHTYTEYYNTEIIIQKYYTEIVKLYTEYESFL